MKRGFSEIFAVFARVAASSFGGVNFWLRRALVQEKRWMDDRDYLEALAVAQVLPGPNALNLAVMLGHRFGGYPGALAAFLGLLMPPLVVIVGLGLLYQRYNAVPAVQAALRGMTFAVAGLVLANATALAAALPKRVLPWVFLVLSFVGVGALRLPLVAVMGALAPFAVAREWRARRKDHQ